MTIPTRPVYLNQLARARRGYYRLLPREAATLEEILVGLNDYEDSLWAFLQNCWHVRDWIMNDPLLPRELKKAVVADVDDRDSAPTLAIVADLANGSKHLAPSRNPHAGGAEIATLSFNPPVAIGGKYSWDHMVRLEDDSYVTVVEIGRSALLEWKVILTKHGLPVPPGWVDP